VVFTPRPSTFSTSRLPRYSMARATARTAQGWSTHRSAVLRPTGTVGAALPAHTARSERFLVTRVSANITARYAPPTPALPPAGAACRRSACRAGHDHRVEDRVDCRTWSHGLESSRLGQAVGRAGLGPGGGKAGRELRNSRPFSWASSWCKRSLWRCRSRDGFTNGFTERAIVVLRKDNKAQGSMLVFGTSAHLNRAADEELVPEFIERHDGTLMLRRTVWSLRSIAPSNVIACAHPKDVSCGWSKSRSASKARAFTIDCSPINQPIRCPFSLRQ
jgi:hypothetical protein